MRTIRFGAAIGLLAGLSLRTLAADPLDSWTLRNPSPTPNDLRAVAAGAGIVVAVGSAGTVVTSADSGETWAAQETGITNVNHHLVAVAYGGGKFVALPASGTQMPILTSATGTNWATNATFMTNSTFFTGLAHGGGTFVAVGYGGGTNRILTSPDGLSWTERSCGTNDAINAITYAQGQFVAAGGTAFPTNRGFIMTSPDGITWTLRRTNIPALFVSVAGNATGFVAVGGRLTSRSVNGVTWTDTTDLGPGFAGRNAVAASASLFVAADTQAGNNDFSVFHSSTNGAAWTTNGSLESVSALMFASGRFYAVGTANQPGASPLGTRPALMISDDGILWRRRALGMVPAGLRFVAMAHGNGSFVAISTNTLQYGAPYSSSNALDWTGNYFSFAIPDMPRAMLFTNGQFVVVGGGASAASTLISTSPDGTNWTTRFTGLAGALMGVAHGNNTYVAMGRRSGTETVAFVSTNGTNWNLLGAGTTNSFHGLTFGGGTFVAVGAAGAVARSTDGTNWTHQSVTSSNDLRAVTFAGGQFVAVGDWGAIFTSPTGVTWARRTSGTSLNLYTVTHFNGRFVAGGESGKTLTSTDGATWASAVSAVDATIYSSVIGSGRLVHGCDHGAVQHSTNGLAWQVANAFGADNGVYRDIIGVDDRIIATGSTHARSSTGRTWAVTSSGGFVAGNGAIYTNGLLVAVGRDATDQVSTISVSTNRGGTWFTTNLGTFGQLYGITHANGLFVVTGDRPGGSNAVIATSTNAYNWTLRNSGTNTALWDVAYGNGLFVAVGSSGGVRSSDGIIWTGTPNAKGETITFGAGRFVTAGAGAAVSTDGINWTSTLTNTILLENVRHGVGTFVAAGPSGILTSTNGSNWINRPVRTQQKLNAVDFANDSFYVIGFGATVFQSGFVTNSPAAILRPPESLTVLSNATATFTVSATGRLPLSFQWFKNGSPISGATEITLTLTNVTAADAGTYQVAVNNEFGSQTSVGATLTVINAAVSVEPPTLYAFTNTGASFLASVSGATPTGYQWDNNGSPIAGATNASLTFTNIQMSNGLGQYYVSAIFPFGQVRSGAANLVVLTNVSEVYLYTDPGYQTVPIGDTASITSVVYGPLPSSYQWYKDNAVIAGATNAVITLASAQLTNSGDYTFTVGYPQGTASNAAASTLIVYYAEPPLITDVNEILPGLMQISFTGLTNRYYQVDYATNLGTPTVWQYYGDTLLLANPAIYNVNPGSFGLTNEAYFRLKILPP